MGGTEVFNEPLEPSEASTTCLARVLRTVDLEMDAQRLGSAEHLTALVALMNLSKVLGLNVIIEANLVREHCRAVLADETPVNFVDRHPRVAQADVCYERQSAFKYLTLQINKVKSSIKI